ncbi:hypothetical protein [Aestuariivirga sp.]|uniref:hypothetical protein n=1 Tax=Aestuariivirga sp. TaxID=2650926 RepID=UPI003BACF049
MTDNFVLTVPHRHAIYLPAVNSSYAKVGRHRVTPERQLPGGLTVSDFEFWTGNSKLWNHKFILHSIGNYSVGADTRGPLFSRPSGAFTIVGDSGGYQLGKNRFKGFGGLTSGMSSQSAVNVWNSRYDEKRWIINWLEHYCDYAMTIDMPLWATQSRGSESPFHRCSEVELLALTNDNLQLIQQLTNGKTKWLNVVQATNLEDGLRWWNGIKWFRHGGWSLGGAAGWRGGLYIMLNILLTMRDDHAFEAGQDWLHVLGVSQTKWDIFLTAIQNGLRCTNPSLQVSCDSATAFDLGGRFDKYALSPTLGEDESDWSISFGQIEHRQSYADSNSPLDFPASSPLGDVLKMHHLVVKTEEISGRRFDTLSNLMLINHNVWTYLDASRRANSAAFASVPRKIPQAYARTIDIIGDAFSRESWSDFLLKERPALDAVARHQS